MAKRGNRRRQRETDEFANRWLLPVDDSPLSDLRRWVPDRGSLPLRDDGRPSQVTDRSTVKRRQTVRGWSSGSRQVRSSAELRSSIPGTVMAFVDPERVMVCQRRKTRRQVLHAMDRLNSGRGGSRRRNKWSKISCK